MMSLEEFAEAQRKRLPMFTRFIGRLHDLRPFFITLWIGTLAPLGVYWIGTQITSYNYYATGVDAQARIITAQFYSGAISQFADVLSKALEAK